jgi:transcriptional regulator with XRE-family HTH domain
MCMSLPTEQFPNDESVSQRQPDVAWLREARESKGLTLELLANTTKISPKTLTAIEAGAADKLPPVFFTRGFVKAYAKEVGLDPDQTADRFLDEIAPGARAADGEDVAAIVETAVARTGVVGFEKHHAPLLSAQRPDRSARLILAAASIGAVLYLGPFNWDRWTSNVGASTVAQSAPADVPSTAPAPAAEAAPAQVVADVAGGPLQFEMKPQGECWFSATADGNQSRSELLKAGDLRPIEVRDALVLRVGDPGACAFSINGRTGRALGTPGAPVTVRITKDNFKEFLSS